MYRWTSTYNCWYLHLRVWGLLIDHINPGNIKFELRDHDFWILGWDVFPWLKATYKKYSVFCIGTRIGAGWRKVTPWWSKWCAGVLQPRHAVASVKGNLSEPLTKTNSRAWGLFAGMHLTGHSEPAVPTTAPSTECPLLLGCGWTSPELIFSFILVTNSVGNRLSYIGR